jgi:hypothetical protein
MQKDSAAHHRKCRDRSLAGAKEVRRLSSRRALGPRKQKTSARLSPNSLADQAEVTPGRQLLLKIGRNQIIRTSASANIDPGCGGTYQIAVGIEGAQKARLIGAGIWLNSPQCIFVYEK